MVTETQHTFVRFHVNLEGFTFLRLQYWILRRLTIHEWRDEAHAVCAGMFLRVSLGRPILHFRQSWEFTWRKANLSFWNSSRPDFPKVFQWDLLDSVLSTVVCLYFIFENWLWKAVVVQSISRFSSPQLSCAQRLWYVNSLFSLFFFAFELLRSKTHFKIWDLVLIGHILRKHGVTEWRSGYRYKSEIVNSRAFWSYKRYS